MSQDPAWRAHGAECCICREGIEPRGPDPVELCVWVADSEATQTLYAHHACLRRVVDRGVPLLGEVSG